MTKINRKINQQRMNQGKQKTMDYVMGKIHKEKTFSLKHIYYILTPVLTLVLLLVVFSTLNNNPIDEDYDFNKTDTESIVELSYLSSSLISTSFNTQNKVIFLSNEETTEFENNEDTINLYFDTLKVFLEEEQFTHTLTELTDGEYTHLLEFIVDDTTYEFYINLIDRNFTGALIINSIEFTVTGSIVDEETETKIQITSTNGDDYVNIEIKTELTEETEKKFEVKQRINGVESEKEFNVSFEDNESKVEIKEGVNVYSLKKEIDNGEIKFKLEYTIQNQNGQAVITETANGYAYQVTENGKEISIEKGKPDTPGNNNSKGNGSQNESPNGNPNQSNPYPQKENKKISI